MNPHYRRRSLGQRLTDTALTGVAFVIFLGPVLVQHWQDRRAGAR